MTKENQQVAKPALPPALRLHLEQRDRALRQLEISDELVERTVERAIEQSRGALSSRRLMVAVSAVLGAAGCFLIGMKVSRHELQEPMDVGLKHADLQVKHFVGNPARLFDSDARALVQYYQCKASKLDESCTIGFRNALIVVDPSHCESDQQCAFLVAGRLTVDEYAATKASEEWRNALLYPETNGSGSAADFGSAAAGGSQDPSHMLPRAGSAM